MDVPKKGRKIDNTADKNLSTHFSDPGNIPGPYLSIFENFRTEILRNILVINGGTGVVPVDAAVWQRR